MKFYTYCRIGRKLQDNKANLKVLSENKILDKINKKFKLSISYHTCMIELLDRKES